MMFNDDDSDFQAASRKVQLHWHIESLVHGSYPIEWRTESGREGKQTRRERRRLLKKPSKPTAARTSGFLYTQPK
jgi:hypothetical protein